MRHPPNLLTGGIDERFTRTDSNGTENYLTDAVGSSVALTNQSGNSNVQYSYDPYGSPSITGSTTNSYMYTGRESDGLGLYYYRARYYNPHSGRFISEDPMGLAAGPNVYQYVGGSPINGRDPSGKLGPEGCVIGMTGYEFGQVIRGLSGRKMDSGWDEAKGLATSCAFGLVTEGIGEWAQAFAEMGELGETVAATERSSFVFHGSEAPYETIFNEGLTPNSDSMDLLAHANDSWVPPSGYVSTSTSFESASEFGSNVYVISTPSNAIDVNAALGPESPFPAEQEMAVPGPISGSQIRAVTIPSQGISILNPGYIP